MKVFISYSHLDKDFAQQCHDYLKEHEFEIYWDQNMDSNASLTDVLQEAMLDCDAVLVLYTENGQKSVNVSAEMMMAFGYSRVREKPQVVPYVENSSSLPFQLEGYEFICKTDNQSNDMKMIVQRLNTIWGTIKAKNKDSSEKVEKLNTSFAAHIESVIRELQRNRKLSRFLSFFFYGGSLLTLFYAIHFTIDKVMLLLLPPVYSNFQFDIAQGILIAITSILIIALMSAISRWLFILGKAFMVDSIRYSDRRHAILFGKFFIEVYGDKATRTEIREVFGEWNIDKGSSFHTQETKDFDPNISGILDVIKSAITKM